MLLYNIQQINHKELTELCKKNFEKYEYHAVIIFQCLELSNKYFIYYNNKLYYWYSSFMPFCKKNIPNISVEDFISIYMLTCNDLLADDLYIDQQSINSFFDTKSFLSIILKDFNIFKDFLNKQLIKLSYLDKNNYKDKIIENIDYILDLNSSVIFTKGYIGESVFFIKHNTTYGPGKIMDITYYSPDKIIYNILYNNSGYAINEKNICKYSTSSSHIVNYLPNMNVIFIKNDKIMFGTILHIIISPCDTIMYCINDIDEHKHILGNNEIIDSGNISYIDFQNIKIEYITQKNDEKFEKNIKNDIKQHIKNYITNIIAQKNNKKFEKNNENFEENIKNDIKHIKNDIKHIKNDITNIKNNINTSEESHN